MATEVLSGVAAHDAPPLAARAIVRPLPEWLTPLRALAAVQTSPHTVFFESGGDPLPSSEWTLLAFDPLWRFEVVDGALTAMRDGRRTRCSGGALEALAAAWPARSAIHDAPPMPFRSGLAGAIAYDFKDCVERFPQRSRRERSLPDLTLGFYDVVWGWRRSTGEGWCVATGLAEAAWHAATGSAAMTESQRERRAIESLAAQWDRLTTGASARSGGGYAESASAKWPRPSIRSNFTRDGYCRMVETALEHIAAGDIYQVNLSQRFLADPALPGPALYRALRAAAPAPFAAYLTLQDAAIASSSPERFFQIRGREIETWPIKGTRPRGATPEQDAALRDELIRSEKDRAENVMIVDLERNDLGRVCATGSVRVPELCAVASHSNVHHFESRVVGTLRDDATPAAILRALFPGGSITGTPKIRSVQIIDALEPVRRGFYTGALGYWDVSGDCDWNIAIRTMVAGGGTASFHAGGGIVADSTPEGEYEETLVKASGMLRALGATFEG